MMGHLLRRDGLSFGAVPPSTCVQRWKSAMHKQKPDRDPESPSSHPVYLQSIGLHCYSYSILVAAAAMLSSKSFPCIRRVVLDMVEAE